MEDTILEEVQEVQTEDTVDAAPETPKEDTAPVEKVALFEYADMHLKCSCGADSLITEGVERGIMRYDLPTSPEHTLVMQCPVCEQSLTLYFKEGVAPVIDETVEGLDTPVESDDEPINESYEQVPEESETKEQI